MMAAAGRPTTRAGGDAVDGAEIAVTKPGDRPRPVAERRAKAAGRRPRSAAGRASAPTSGTSETGDRWRPAFALDDARDAVRRSTEAAASATMEQVRARPGLALSCAVVVGMALGWLLRRP